MRDKKLERQIDKFENFIELWKRFYDLFLLARSQENVSQDDEKEFFEIKTVIARNYNVLMDSIGINDGNDSGSLEMLSQVVSLADAKDISDGIAKRITSVWNTKYLDFQKILGELEHNKEELAYVSGFKIFLKKLFWNPVTIFVYILILGAGGYILFNILNERFGFFL